MSAGIVLRLLPFIAFLQRHIADIPHQQLLLVYDNETAVEADYIADALNGIPVATTCIHWSLKDVSIPSVRFRLIISLVPESTLLKNQHKGVDGFHFKYMFVSTATSVVYVPKAEAPNAVHVILHTNRVEFCVWRETELLRIPDEKMFVRSVYWPRFRGQMTRMESEVDGVSVLGVCVSFAIYPVSHENRKKLTGVLVGIHQMIARYIGVPRLNYHFKCKVPSFPVVRTVAAGQTDDYIPYKHPKHWSFAFQREGDWNAYFGISYMVLAPRKPILHASGLPGDWQQLVYVTVLVGVAAGLATIRTYFRRRSASRPNIWEPLFFDTFSRLLSISPGRWNGAAGERLLLTVIAVLSVLMGGLFSGILYQMNFVRTVSEQYNTIQELCADQVEVLLVPFFENEHTLAGGAPSTYTHCVKIGLLKINPKLDPDKAYILNTIKISRFFDAATHHILPDPYGTFPIPLFVSHWYLEYPILQVSSRLMDHGIYLHMKATALYSALVTAVNMKALGVSIDAKNDGVVNVTLQWHFGWSVLVFGWLVSAGSLLGEVAVVKIWT